MSGDAGCNLGNTANLMILHLPYPENGHWEASPPCPSVLTLKVLALEQSLGSFSRRHKRVKGLMMSGPESQAQDLQVAQV